MNRPVRVRAEQRDGAGEPLAKLGMGALGHGRQIERGRAAEQGPEHRTHQHRGNRRQPSPPERPPHRLGKRPGEIGPDAQHRPDRTDQGHQAYPP